MPWQTALKCTADRFVQNFGYANGKEMHSKLNKLEKLDLVIKTSH
jgi:hypothetical protein